MLLHPSAVLSLQLLRANGLSISHMLEPSGLYVLCSCIFGRHCSALQPEASAFSFLADFLVDPQEEDGSDSDTDDTPSSSGAAAALEEQRQQARRHRARTILSLSRLLPQARSHLLSAPGGLPGQAAMAAAAMLTAQGLRQVLLPAPCGGTSAACPRLG